MSSNTKHIYEEHIKPLSREQQVQLLALLRNELENEHDKTQRRNIFELHGLGKEIWKDIDANEYVKRLRDEWEERR